MSKGVWGDAGRVQIVTGNVLAINEITIKVGQTPAEELLESLKLIVNNDRTIKTSNNGLLKIGPLKANEEQQNAFESEGKNDLKYNVKVFLSGTDKEGLQEAINSAFASLETDKIDALVLACACCDEAKAVKSLSCLQELWEVLENFVERGKIQSIGFSDIDTDSFISLYNWAKVKPSIVQINLATCCVVPPALQEFTKQHDIQILTTSDPADILPKESLHQIVGSDLPYQSAWVFRYQVHVKCRGVLASKGYVVGLKHC